LKTLPALQGPHDESLLLGSVGDDNQRAHAAVLGERAPFRDCVSKSLLRPSIALVICARVCVCLLSQGVFWSESDPKASIQKVWIMSAYTN
jgi:hypothetical protein